MNVIIAALLVSTICIAYYFINDFKGKCEFKRMIEDNAKRKGNIINIKIKDIK